jgi:hypothetical protein
MQLEGSKTKELKRNADRQADSFLVLPWCQQREPAAAEGIPVANSGIPQDGGHKKSVREGEAAAEGVSAASRRLK